MNKEELEIKIAKDLLSIKAVFFRPEEPFTWASGIKSPEYCDNRLTLTAPNVRDDVENGLAEIVKTYHNSAKECNFHYYRDKESNEIDLVIESNGETHPLEIKKSSNPAPELAGAFKILDKGSLPRGVGAILCLGEELSAIDRKTYIVPVWMI